MGSRLDADHPSAGVLIPRRFTPDIERLEDEGLLQGLKSDIDLDGALGILGGHDPLFADAMELDEADEG